MHYIKTKNLLSLLVITIFLTSSCITRGSDNPYIQRQRERRRVEKLEKKVNSLEKNSQTTGRWLVSFLGEVALRAVIANIVNRGLNAPYQIYDWYYYSKNRRLLKEADLDSRTLVQFQEREKRSQFNSILTQNRKNEYTKKYGKVNSFDKLPPEHKKLLKDQIIADFEEEIIEKMGAIDEGKNLCQQDLQCNTNRDHFRYIMNELEQPDDPEERTIYVAIFGRFRRNFTDLTTEGVYAGDKTLYEELEKIYVKNSDASLKEYREREKKAQEAAEKELSESPDDKGLKDAIAAAA